jgi:L-aminopeptidase/D-esterase-like protein
VGAIIAVNAAGDVIDPQTGEIMAGTRPVKVGPISVGEGEVFANTLVVMKSMAGKLALRFASRSNTVIGVIATNAALTKEESNKVAQMAHDGLARTVRPAHTMLDGDTLFSLSTGKKSADVNLIGAYAAEVVAKAIVSAVSSAQSAGGIPAAADL